MVWVAMFGVLLRGEWDGATATVGAAAARAMSVP
jgi:hypothetical protein